MEGATAGSSEPAGLSSTEQNEEITEAIPETENGDEPDANPSANPTKRKRRTNEEISLQGIITSKKRRNEEEKNGLKIVRDKLVHIHRYLPLPARHLIMFLSPQLTAFAKFGLNCRTCGLDFMLVTVNTSNDIKSRASKGLAGLAGPNWLNIEEVLPAFQVQAKMQV